jgi:quinol monooxygenase YgiN
MSGRRRRDDGWADGRQDAQDDRRDPWADNSIEDWADGDREHGAEVAWPGASAGETTVGREAVSRAGRGGATVSPKSEPSAKAYPPPPAFPSFQMNGNGKNGASAGSQDSAHSDERYGAASGYGGQRGPANGSAAPGYSGAASAYNGERQAGAGRGAPGDGYPEAGSARVGQGARRDAAGHGGDSAASGYGQQDRESGGGYGAGGYGVNGRPAGGLPGFTPADNDDLDDDGPSGTPRPIGRLSIYTLHDDKTKEFDRIAERAAEGVRSAEPDTLVYVIHVVPKAPMQRIIYEIYRDRAAFLSHERQPHIRQFAADRASCVLATNVIDLRLKYAKVAALGAPAEAPVPQPGWTPRAPEPVLAGNDRYAAAQPQTAQYAGAGAGAQYPEAQPAAAATFTPAKDLHPAENRQYSATGREQYPTTAQYDSPVNGGYGAADLQYGTANGYSGTPGYANGSSYPSAKDYPGANGYSAGAGYQGANGYAAGNGYQGANGYSDANGYSNGSGYPGAAGYSNGAAYPNGSAYPNGAAYPNGSAYSNNTAYPEGTAYSNGTAYPNGSAYGNGAGYPNGNGYPGDAGYANGAGGGYGAAGYPDNAGAAPGAQYTPRYRELSSSGPGEAAPGYGDAAYPGGAYGSGAYGTGARPGSAAPDSAYPDSTQQDKGGRYGDDGRQQPARSPEWIPHSPDQR